MEEGCALRPALSRLWAARSDRPARYGPAVVEPEPGRAIVVGGYVNGLGVLRALAARGVRTAVPRTQPYDIAHRSRWCVGDAAVAELGAHPDALAEALLARAPRWRGAVVYPTNDEALAALALHRDQLSSWYRLASPPQEVAGYLLDKRLMRTAAEAVGAKLPVRYGAASAATAALEVLRFPVLVKPSASHRFASAFGAKLFTARDRAELRQCVRRVEEASLPADVVDFVPGDDSEIHAYCTYLDRHGEPGPGLLVRKLRQSPPLFGVARAAEIVRDVPGLRELTVELARRIGLHGIAVAEFKRDPRDGVFRFIEINGRAVVYNALTRRAGLDLAALAFAEAVEGAPARVAPHDWPGIWVNLHADLLYATLRREVEPVGVGALLAGYRRPMLEAVWSSRDPAPFLTQWGHTARDGVAALLGGRLGDVTADRNRLPF